MIILASKGIQTREGEKIIHKALEKARYDSKNLSNKSILLCALPEYGIEKVLINAAMRLGFTRENIFVYETGMIGQTFDFSYVSEGNVFRISAWLKDTGAEEIIKTSVKAGGTYIGVSAGAMLAGSSIEFGRDFEQNRIGLTDMRGLSLLENIYGSSIIIPHYSKKEFGKWRRLTPEVFKYEFVDYIPEKGVRIYKQ